MHAKSKKADGPSLRQIDVITSAAWDENKQFMAECFARFVISQGYGARAPRNIGTDGSTKYETWNECGRRLFGQRFNSILRGELKSKANSN